MRVDYTQALAQLRQHVLDMGCAIEEAIGHTQTALETLDPALACRIIQGDDAFDEMERRIEQECLDLVVTQAPVAGDWRRIASVMRMIADLERIADHCSDICEYVLRLEKAPRVPPIPYFDEMFFQMQRMVSGPVRAYVELDVAAAEEVARQDDVQDDYFEEVLEELAHRMAAENAAIPQYIDYLLIAKYLERMSDHATNLAGWIAYIVRGELQL